MAMKEPETQSIESKHRITLPELGWEDLSQPGTYVLRGLADDGALTGYDEVTVTVTK